MSPTLPAFLGVGVKAGPDSFPRDCDRTPMLRWRLLLGGFASADREPPLAKAASRLLSVTFSASEKTSSSRAGSTAIQIRMAWRNGVLWDVPSVDKAQVSESRFGAPALFSSS